MTVKGLARLLKSNNVPYLGRYNDEDTSTPFYLNALAGKRVAIESAGIIYKQMMGAVRLAIGRHEFTYGDDGWSKPSDDDVLEIFRWMFRSYMERLLSSGIVPIVVIEGRSPTMKSDTIQNRSNDRCNKKEQAECARKSPNVDDYKKYLRSAYHPCTIHVDAAIDVMRNLGITMLRANHEGEGVCAKLVNDPNDPYHCVCAIIDDYDIFMYGCRTVVRNLRYASDRVGGFEGTAYAHIDIPMSLGLINMVDGKPDMNDYKMATHRFRLMCILSGTDYHPNVRDVGCVRVLKAMRTKEVEVTTIKVGDHTMDVHTETLRRFDGGIPHIPMEVRSSPSSITRFLESHDGPLVQYEIVSTYSKRIDTYEEMCIIDPRFKSIPYYQIISTLKANMTYTPIE